MGGHGGLNILPQKKWNVYNYDNRAIVDKDKKEASAKQRAEYEKKRENGLQGKMDVLKQDQGIPSSTKDDNKHSLITQELRKMNDKNKHINLFEKEQQIIENREIQEMKRLQEAEFLKGKDTMDLSSKFLGTYADDKTKPWYIKHKKDVQSTQRQQIRGQKYNKNQIKQHDDVKIECDSQIQRSREKKERIKIEYGTEKSDMEIMREKRLRRQMKQRLKLRRLQFNKDR